MASLPWSKPNWFADETHLLAVTLPPLFVLCIALSLVWLCRLRKSEVERLGYERVDLEQ